MRTPTPLAERWRYWETVIAGEKATRHLNDDPPCGFFKARRFRWSAWPSHKNPWLPARIYAPTPQIDDAGELLEPERLIAEINGRTFNPWLNESWMYWTPIPEMEWKFLKALSPLTATKPPKRR